MRIGQLADSLGRELYGVVWLRESSMGRIVSCPLSLKYMISFPADDARQLISLARCLEPI